MIFELVYFRAQHDLDTSIWIIWIPHMSAITCRSSLLKLFAHPTHTHTNSIQWQYPFVELGWWHHRVAKHQSEKSTATYTWYILIHSVSNYTLLTTRSVVLKLSNLHICCKSPQVLEEGLQREMMRNAPLSTLRHKCLNPSVFQYLWLMTVSKFSTLWKYTRVKAPIGRVHVYSFLWHRCPMCLGSPCLGQETVTDVRNIP